jgi:hypothetical protein
MIAPDDSARVCDIVTKAMNQAEEETERFIALTRERLWAETRAHAAEEWRKTWRCLVNCMVFVGAVHLICDAILWLAGKP